MKYTTLQSTKDLLKRNDSSNERVRVRNRRKLILYTVVYQTHKGNIIMTILDTVELDNSSKSTDCQV